MHVEAIALLLASVTLSCPGPKSRLVMPLSPTANNLALGAVHPQTCGTKDHSVGRKESGWPGILFLVNAHRLALAA